MARFPTLRTIRTLRTGRVEKLFFRRNLAENAWRIFPYAVGPSAQRWNSEESRACPSSRSMVCALLATAQPGGAGSEWSELSELSEKFAVKFAFLAFLTGPPAFPTRPRLSKNALNAPSPAGIPPAGSGQGRWLCV